jgi:hypothetical protein
MQQSVNQSSAVSVILGSSGAGVHHHSSRLIYDGKVIVLVNNVERNLFRHGPQWRTFNFTNNLNALPSAQMERSFGWLSIYKHFFLRNELLDPGTAGVGKLRD